MGIRKTILLLLLSVFVPLLFLQAFTFYSWYRERKAYGDAVQRGNRQDRRQILRGIRL